MGTFADCCKRDHERLDFKNCVTFFWLTVEL